MRSDTPKVGKMKLFHAGQEDHPAAVPPLMVLGHEVMSVVQRGSVSWQIGKTRSLGF